MTEAEWLACVDSVRLVGSLRTASDRKLHLFACAVCRTIWPRLSDLQRRGVQIAESFADGSADGKLRAKHLHRLECLDKQGGKEMWLSTSVLAECGWYAAELIAGCSPDVTQEVCFVSDIFGNPFRPVSFAPAWLTSTVTTLARQMYDSRDFSAMPILADALQDAGCDNADILNHCRSGGPHVRGCWVLDRILG